jgi:hypothetical protein
MAYHCLFESLGVNVQDGGGGGGGGGGGAITTGGAGFLH